uniref:Response regulator receiver n=1 Tax=Geobacillus sp. (strain Y4.1MC1) TaxID=581103 RepID=A0A7U3YHL8_GEOS0
MYKTVLIADDSRFTRNLLKKLLTDNGYQVVAEAVYCKIKIQSSARKTCRA